MVSHKPFSQACENNKDPILAVIAPAFAAAQTVLEIGSGTGQHAVHFGAALPHLVWQTSDVEDNHPGICAWLKEAALPNVRSPLHLDVDGREWLALRVEGVFSANTAHIMSWEQVINMVAGVGVILSPGGVFCLYGPFNYSGRYTSESNARFDQWLKARDPLSGIRDFEAIDELARGAGLDLQADHPMPANNRTLVWRKRAQ